jgi:hypothetical protein
LMGTARSRDIHNLVLKWMVLFTCQNQTITPVCLPERIP